MSDEKNIAWGRSITRGVAFRVRGPHAQRVFVSASFSAWDGDKHVMQSKERLPCVEAAGQTCCGGRMEILIWIGILICISQSAMFSGLNLAFLGISRLRLEVERTNGNRDAQKSCS